MFKKLLIMLLAVAIPSIALAQSPVKFGVGVSGGLNVPVVQNDQGRGTIFGVRGIFSAMKILTLEPNLNFAKYGDPSLDLEGVTDDLEGSKVTSYGVDAILGAPLGTPGLAPFVIAGVGFYKAKRDQTAVIEDEESKFGWSAGLGFAFGVSPTMAIDVRGRFNMIPEDGSSKKSLFLTGGLNYYFGVK